MRNLLPTVKRKAVGIGLGTEEKAGNRVNPKSREGSVLYEQGYREKCPLVSRIMAYPRGDVPA